MGWEFLKDFFTLFVNSLISIFYIEKSSDRAGGIFGGLFEMFNFSKYGSLFLEFCANKPTFGDWVIAIIGILLVIVILVGIVFLLVISLKKLFERILSKETNGDLIAEIARLRAELRRSEKNRDRLLQLKLQGKDNILSFDPYNNGIDNSTTSVVNLNESRFYKLIEVDKKYLDYQRPNFNEDLTLEKICEEFRIFACLKLNLYYDKKIIRLFISALATTKIIILQGISGTGKTSLPYAFGKWLGNPATITSVQPYWRDKSEIFGYFNEFTKKFNETEVLKSMYEARYSDEIFLTIVDEANIARVEYYFAELLSVLEMPSKDNWIINITSRGWDNDPILIEGGRFKLPENMWYVLTINNDDSTFKISDKVYDRAIPISINFKGVPFEVDGNVLSYKDLKLSYQYIEKLFNEALEKYSISSENLKKIDNVNDYLIKHFKLSFGNRIIKQMKEFIPVYIACGGDENECLDYFLCNKILRKLESFNLTYIRDEIDDFIDYLNSLFTENMMVESKEYLLELKKFF